MSKAPGKLKPADATVRINSCARDPGMHLTKTLHVKERLLERGLIEADLLHLLKNGFVYDEGETATRDGYFKYRIEGTTPNSDGRTVRAVVIPGNGCALKVVTIMWKDET